MKIRIYCLRVVGLALILVGCSGADRVDTGAVEVAFEMVSGTNRVLLDTSLEHARTGRFREAAAGFQEIERGYRLNPRQELAIKMILRDLERREPSPALPPGTNAPTARPSP